MVQMLEGGPFMSSSENNPNNFSTRERISSLPVFIRPLKVEDIDTARNLLVNRWYPLPTQEHDVNECIDVMSKSLLPNPQSSFYMIDWQLPQDFDTKNFPNISISKDGFASWGFMGWVNQEEIKPHVLIEAQKFMDNSIAFEDREVLQFRSYYNNTDFLKRIGRHLGIKQSEIRDFIINQSRISCAAIIDKAINEPTKEGKKKTPICYSYKTYKAAHENIYGPLGFQIVSDISGFDSESVLFLHYNDINYPLVSTDTP